MEKRKGTDMLIYSLKRETPERIGQIYKGIKGRARVYLA